MPIKKKTNRLFFWKKKSNNKKLVMFKMCHAVMKSVGTSDRPWREFLKKPSLPIRSNYVYRYLTNVVYFSRNYLNLITACLMVWSLVYPVFFLCLALAINIHLCADPVKKMILKCLQVISFGYFIACYSVFPCVVAFSTILSFVSLHALTTPYTDEASRHFEEVTGHLIEAPTTPVYKMIRVRQPQNHYS